jgi:hypothetical protein
MDRGVLAGQAFGSLDRRNEVVTEWVGARCHAPEATCDASDRPPNRPLIIQVQ